MSTQATHSNMSKVEHGAKQKEEHRVKTSLRMVQAAVMECEAEEAKQQRSTGRREEVKSRIEADCAKPTDVEDPGVCSEPGGHPSPSASGLRGAHWGP